MEFILKNPLFALDYYIRETKHYFMLIYNLKKMNFAKCCEILDCKLVLAGENQFLPGFVNPFVCCQLGTAVIT